VKQKQHKISWLRKSLCTPYRWWRWRHCLRWQLSWLSA